MIKEIARVATATGVGLALVFGNGGESNTRMTTNQNRKTETSQPGETGSFGYLPVITSEVEQAASTELTEIAEINPTKEYTMSSLPHEVRYAIDNNITAESAAKANNKEKFDRSKSWSGAPSEVIYAKDHGH